MPQKSLPGGKEFLSWALGKWDRVLGVGVALAYAGIVALSREDAKGASGILLRVLPVNLPPKSLPSLFQAIALLPLPFACYMATVPPWLRRREDEGSKAAMEACDQFKWALALLTTMWIVFYALVFADMWKGKDLTRELWIDFFNNLQGVFLFAGYWILTAKTTPAIKSDKDGMPEDARIPLWAVCSLLLWVVLVFGAADNIFSNGGSAGSAIDHGQVRELFQLLSGLWVGASLALLVGCLEGQYLGKPRWIAFFLYFYAALQVAYANFFSSDSLTVELLVTITSLPLKLLFIGFWIWAQEIGLLAFYMRRTREDIDQVHGQWVTFHRS